MLDAVLRSFSCPPAPGKELLSLIISGAGASTLRQGLNVSASELTRHASGLSSFLEDWLHAPGNIFWHPNISRMRAELSGPKKEIPLKFFVEMGILALLDKAKGSWSFRFHEPTLLLIHRWVLRDTLHGTVETNGTGIDIRIYGPGRSASEITLIRDADGIIRASSWSGELIAQLPVVRFSPGHEIVLLPETVVNEELLPQYPDAKFEDMAGLSKFASCLSESAELIASKAPEYLDWIADVIRFVAPVHAPANLRGSSSSPKLSGMISISYDPSPLVIAEFLVHEASHQYLAIANHLGELDDGPEGALFYSRFARRHRPLDRVLAAFHALGNIALFYELCFATGTPCRERFAYISTHLREVDKTLRDANTLSSIGRCLWLPLSEKTRHLDMEADEVLSWAALEDSDRVMALSKQASQ